MRMTIIPVDSMIIIDGFAVSDVDLSWVPDNVHAVQWYETYGEVELIGRVPNIDITELGIYEQAVPIWEVKKLELEQQEIQRLEQVRLMEEEQQRQVILKQYQMISNQNSENLSEILSEESTY